MASSGGGLCGSSSVSLDPPRCPRPGHDDTRVTLGGTYGTPSRQMFWCKSADGKAWHGCAGVLPRLIADGAVCQHCDNAVHRHEWHLRKNARKAMGLAGVGDFDRPMRPLLDVAFTDPASWAAFSAAAQAFP